MARTAGGSSSFLRLAEAKTLVFAKHKCETRWQTHFKIKKTTLCRGGGMVDTLDSKSGEH